MRSIRTVGSLVFALAIAGCSDSDPDATGTTGAAETSAPASVVVIDPPAVPVSSPSTTSASTQATSTEPRAASTAVPEPTPTAPTVPATTTSSPPPSATSPQPDAPPDTSPMEVAWVGGSEVELRDVSLPAIADGLGLTAGSRLLRFGAITTIAASPDDTRAMVSSALDNGADALIVTLNPQWLYGRVCEGIEQPHARYACLLADGELSGGPAIDALMATIAGSGVPALLVLMPTSVDALENPELNGLITLANDRLAERVPAQPGMRVLDESLTAGRPEFREGAGFHDMVHTTPDGARLLAGAIAAELVGLLGQT